MVQRAAAEDAPQPAESLFAGTPEELGRGWVVLKECRLGPARRDAARPAVLLHPSRGVAVLDMPPSETPGAVGAVRAKLDAAGFGAAFEGHLPVVHLQVTQDEMLLLPLLLEETFAEQQPLRLPAGGAWVGAAMQALTAEPPAPRPPEPTPLPACPDAPSRRPRRARWAAVLRRAGAVLLCLAALGGVLGAALNAASKSAPGATAAPEAGEEPVPRASAMPSRPAAPGPALAASPFLPARADTGAAATVPAPETLPAAQRPPAPIARPPLPDEPPPPPPPQRAAVPQRRPEPAAVAPHLAPTAREPSERAAPRRQREAAGAAVPVAGAAAPQPEEAPDRCRRVAALAALGASLADADMRFFNEACARW